MATGFTKRPNGRYFESTILIHPKTNLTGVTVNLKYSESALTQNAVILRVYCMERLLPKGEVMERREGHIGTNDIGLIIFVIVAGWMLLFQSGLFS